MITNGTEALELLGATVSNNIARYLTGEELHPITFTDIDEAIVALDPSPSPEEQGSLYAYQQAGRQLAGLVVEVELVDERQVPGWQREACSAVIDEVGNFALVSADGQLDRFGKKLEVAQDNETWMAKGIRAALDQVVRYTRTIVESRTLDVMRNWPPNADETVSMMFVAVCAPGTAKLDSVFRQVYGDALSERLVSRGLLEYVGADTNGRLKITDEGVLTLKERLADFKLKRV